MVLAMVVYAATLEENESMMDRLARKKCGTKCTKEFICLFQFLMPGKILKLEQDTAQVTILSLRCIYSLWNTVEGIVACIHFLCVSYFVMCSANTN